MALRKRTRGFALDIRPTSRRKPALFSVTKRRCWRPRTSTTPNVDGDVSAREWFKESRRHLLDDIPKMAQFLEQNERGKYRWSLRLLKWRNRYQTMLSSVARAQG